MASVKSKLDDIAIFEKHRSLWYAKLIAGIGVCMGIVGLVFGRFDQALPTFLGCLALWWLARESAGLWTRVENLQAALDRLQPKSE